MGFEFCIGTCFACGEPFTFNPDLVPSIPVAPGPDGRPEARHPDAGGRREPVCQACIERANPQRIMNGLDPIEILPGAYEATEV